MQLTFENMTMELNIFNLIKKLESYEDDPWMYLSLIIWWRNMWMTSWDTALAHIMSVLRTSTPFSNHLESTKTWTYPSLVFGLRLTPKQSSLGFLCFLR